MDYGSVSWDCTRDFVSDFITFTYLIDIAAWNTDTNYVMHRIFNTAYDIFVFITVKLEKYVASLIGFNTILE